MQGQSYAYLFDKIMINRDNNNAMALNFPMRTL